MQTSTATMENSVEIPLKTGNRTAIQLSNPLLGIHTKETRIERDTCTPMFTAALFTTARTYKQPRCPLAEKWIRKLWYIYIIKCYSALKKHIWISSNEMDETGAYYTEWSKPERKIPIQYAMLCYAKSLQSCLTLCDPIDGSPPGSPVPEILQARTLKWVQYSILMHICNLERW